MSNTCPYVEQTFQIIGKKWSAVIIHFLFTCENHQTNFTDIKQNITHITPRALSLRLQELVELEIIAHQNGEGHPQYQLTQKGIELAQAFQPLQSWAMSHKA